MIYKGSKFVQTIIINYQNVMKMFEVLLFVLCDINYGVRFI